MGNEGMDFSKLLEQHDYDTPNEGDIRTGVIVSISEQGILVDLGLKRDGIVTPADLAKLDPSETESLKVGDDVTVFVVSSHEPDSLIVSIHRARLNQDWIEAEALMKSGEIVEVEVSGYNRGGAIAPFGRIRGFVPASQLTTLRRGMDERQRQQLLSKLRDQKIPVKIIEVDRQRRRLVFSQRAAEKEWMEKRRAEVLSGLKAGDTIHGRITSLRDFGAFVDIGGVDGLVHISELAWHRVKHPRDVVKVGEEIDVLVLKVDHDSQRVALSRRRILPSPWSTVEEKYHVGQLVEGRVVRIMDYGGFIQLEPGVEGLLHVSQLSHMDVGNPRDVIREGEVHLLRIISIDPNRQRIGLSLKAVTVNEQMEWMGRQREAELDAQVDEFMDAGSSEEEE